MTARRSAAAAQLDQVLMALANAGTSVVALVTLPRADAGAMVLALGLAYFVQGLNRALVGEVLLVEGSRRTDDARRLMARHGSTVALALGVAAAVLLGAASSAAARIQPSSPSAIDLSDVIWVSPFVPAVLLHDVGRCLYLASGDPARALRLDFAWLAVQTTSLGLAWLAGAWHGGVLLACWGAGAVAGAATFLVCERIDPLAGRPAVWLAESRSLWGWLTATALVGHAHTQLVAFTVTGTLGEAALAGLRLAQTIVLQPVQNVISGTTGFLVPRWSRLAIAGGQGELQRETRRVAWRLGALGALVLAVVVPLASLARHWPKYADIAPLGLPVGLQAAIYLVQAPYSATMRGMHRARLLFAHYVAFAATSLVGLAIGAEIAGLTGAAWGLTTGAGTGLALMILAHRAAFHGPTGAG